jgi:hypothetical protein
MAQLSVEYFHNESSSISDDEFYSYHKKEGNDQISSNDKDENLDNYRKIYI